METHSEIIDEKESAFIQGDGQYHLEVVAKSHYQMRLKALHKSILKDGSNQNLVASLHYENNNPHDNNAIRVVVNGGTVGYLSRKDAGLYRTMIEQTGQEGIIVSCNAKIFGGKRVRLFKKTNFGVLLDLPIEDL